MEIMTRLRHSCCCARPPVPTERHTSRVHDEYENMVDPIEHHVPSALMLLHDRAVRDDCGLVQLGEVLPVPPLPTLSKWKAVYDPSNDGFLSSSDPARKHTVPDDECKAPPVHTYERWLRPSSGADLRVPSAPTDETKEFPVPADTCKVLSCNTISTAITNASSDTYPRCNTSSSIVSAQFGQEFTVFLKKGEGDKFGIKLRQSTTNAFVSVKSIDQGLFKEWNGAHPDQCVKIGDRLLSVNGVNGPTSNAIVEALQTQQDLELVFVTMGNAS